MVEGRPLHTLTYSAGESPSPRGKGGPCLQRRGGSGFRGGDQALRCGRTGRQAQGGSYLPAALISVPVYYGRCTLWLMMMTHMCFHTVYYVKAGHRHGFAGTGGHRSSGTARYRGGHGSSGTVSGVIIHYYSYYHPCRHPVG